MCSTFFLGFSFITFRVLFRIVSSERHRQEIASVQNAYSQAQTPASTSTHHLPPLQSTTSPLIEPIPIPPRVEPTPPIPQTPVSILQRNLPAGSSHTQHRKTKSILSRPSVRIELHEYVRSLFHCRASRISAAATILSASRSRSHRP